MTDDTLHLHTPGHQRSRLINTLHTWLLLAGSLLLLIVCAWTLAGPAGIIYAFVFGGISLFAIRRISPQMVLKMYKARPVTQAEFPQGLAIVDELARRAGLPAAPKLHVIPSRMMNAFAVGRRDNAIVAVTDQLIRALTARELTGVLAHEISHIRNEDLKVMALADTVSRFTSLMSTIGIVSLLFNITWLASGAPPQVPWLGVLVLLFAPTIGGLLQMALSRTREFDADLGAAMLTGDPDGLAGALIKLEKAQGKVWENLILPGGRIPDPSILRTHPLTEDRVARLNSLKEACAVVARGDSMPEDILAGLSLKPQEHIRTRPRSVPQIGQQYGRWNSNNLEILSLINTQAMVPVVADVDADCEACAQSLYAPDGKPRVHVTRGGVYW
ncbi:peptidase M48 Ste24p [Phyllobacterium brassicacearum]|uniref:Peptidase M48 Ste24p n=1 Tax=Phyllobacterium brassicacearum TaxID=314235 RepID=A0A2P7BBU0_9HYPH|nr:zinc metalloprotease HtpX [Phyllobacterium brassicacearum]PSH63879.1 peptidase M48 Ste24p [Phyllobacterium brassicacearum]TDQ20044.1 heat shock protein HtpX [Phyllobacterium brassicacearum]